MPKAASNFIVQEEYTAQKKLGSYQIIRTDAFDWLRLAKPSSIHAVITDPPYGLVEYSANELQKLKTGRGGIWRIPPSFDGCQRSPVPRFTVLTGEDLAALRAFFKRLAEAFCQCSCPVDACL
jgi:site-specific DNA-methyltransferase (adenine-specific)